MIPPICWVCDDIRLACKITKSLIRYYQLSIICFRSQISLGCQECFQPWEYITHTPQNILMWFPVSDVPDLRPNGASFVKLHTWTTLIWAITWIYQSQLHYSEFTRNLRPSILRTEVRGIHTSGRFRPPLHWISWINSPSTLHLRALTLLMYMTL